MLVEGLCNASENQPDIMEVRFELHAAGSEALYTAC